MRTWPLDGAGAWRWTVHVRGIKMELYEKIYAVVREIRKRHVLDAYDLGYIAGLQYAANLADMEDDDEEYD